MSTENQNDFICQYEAVKQAFEKLNPGVILWPETPEFTHTNVGHEILLETKQQYFVDRLADIIDNTGYPLLVAIVSRDIREYKLLFCAKPNETDMFYIHVETNQHGLASSLVIEFFDSVETMFSRGKKLWEEYNNLLNGEFPYILLERYEKEEFLKLFV